MEQFEDRFPPYYFWRDGGGEFQEYYDGRYVTAGYYAPLTHSLALTNGTGSPTLTRATAMWEFDNEGKLVNVQASAAAFGGARRVRNWFTATDNMSGSDDWAVSNMGKTAALDPAGAAGAVLCTCSANSSNYIRQQYTSAALGGNTRTYKFLYYPGTADWMRLLLFAGSTDRVSVWFNATTNVIGTVSNAGTGWAYVSYDLSTSTDYPGWYELYVIATTPETGTHYMQLGMVDGDNSINTAAVNGKTITLAWPQLENTTGQTDKTPSEYVVGDNGAGINNLKWFNTNKDGTPIAPSSLLGLATNDAAVTNTMLYCRDLRFGYNNTATYWQVAETESGAPELITNGDFSGGSAGWTVTGDWVLAAGVATITSASVASNLTQDVIVEGINYVATFTVVSGSFTGYVYIGLNQLKAYTAAPPGTYTLSCVSISNSFPTRFRIQASIGTTCVIDNVSVKRAAVQITLTQTGLDNASNSCSLLTATAANATILQTITAAAAAGCTGFYVKRSVGTGTISITRDGGTSWTDITSLINSSTFTKVKIENTSVTNPSVGFKIGTSGDAIIVDGGLNHLGTKIHYLPILTTSAAVTVNAQTLTYPDTGNIIDADGTIIATCTADDWTGIDGGVVGSTTRGLFATATGASAKDGTNTPTGASDTPSGTVDIGMKYTTDFMRAMSDAGFGTATDYTGTLATDLTNIGIGSGFTGHIKEVAIWQEVISDYKMRNMP